MMARCSSDGESSRRTSGRVDHAELRSSSTGNLVRRLVGLHGAAEQLPVVLVVGSTSMIRSPWSRIRIAEAIRLRGKVALKSSCANDTVRGYRSSVTLTQSRRVYVNQDAKTQVIVLNGGSSIGLSGIVRGVKHFLPDPWSELGVDDLVERLPPSMVA